MQGQRLKGTNDGIVAHVRTKEVEEKLVPYTVLIHIKWMFTVEFSV